MPARDLTLTLPPDLGRAMAEQAKRLGTTPELLALDSLRKHFVAAVSEKASTAGMETMADFLDGYIGVLDSREHTPGGARMSERCGEKFTAMLVDEHRRKQP